MKTNYAPNSLKWLCLISISLTINYSCNKDDDTLENATLDPASTSVEKENLDGAAFLEENYLSENDLAEMGFETRTAVFRPMENQLDPKIAKDDETEPDRPEVDPGYSYLRYDLSQIDSIGGTLDSAKLQFTMTGGDGAATVSVFKGTSDDWDKTALSSENAPEPVALLGELKGTFSSEEPQEIVLEKSEILSEILTLVIPNTENVAINMAAAKGTNTGAPALSVNYFVPQGAKALKEDKFSDQDINATATSSSGQPLMAVKATASTGNRPPDSRPSASTLSGVAPLKVQFGKGKSSDDKGIASYKWYFMDGTTSTDPNPSHTFTKPGTYKVILSLHDQEGLENGRIIIIRVGASNSYNKRPDSRPSASVVSGKAPLKVQFGKGNSSDDKGIVSYNWYFMDGTTSTSPNPAHTFTQAGTYKVILSIKDQEGLENGRIIIITVTGGTNKAPDARPDASPASGKAPLTVKFGSSKSSDDSGIASYAWDFMDGNKTTGASPTHTFNKPGTYKVVMTATDKGGLTNSRIVVVTVTGTSTGGDTGSGGLGGSSTGSTGGSGDSSSGGSNDIPSNAVKASTFGYNSSDATKALKAAISSSHTTIIVDKQAGDWVVGSLYLNQVRNKTIIFEKGVVLRAKRGAFKPSDRLFQLVNSENVEIQGYGATFAMNKSEYSGQQNHALAIVNSSNITVKGLTLTGAGGDGIYVSRHNGGEYCRNIVVDGVTSTKNQRQGMTVISVDGLQIKNSTFSETSGESPSAGIDFEPEHTSDRLDNITVTNCTFKDNNGPGIMFAVNKVSGNSRPVDATFKNVRVSNNSLNNPRLYPTEIDLGMSSNYVTNPVKGLITFDGLTVENSRWCAIWTKKTLESYHVTVKNTVIRNVSKGSDKAAIHIGLLGYGNKSNANMGGFTFENVLIDYDGVDASLKLYGPSNDNWKLANLRGEIRVKSPRGTQFSDNTNILEKTSSSSVNLRIVQN